MNPNAAPDKLAILAPYALGATSRSTGRSRTFGAVRKRNEAIAQALASGCSAIEIGDRVGLTARTVEDIAKKVDAQPATDRPAETPKILQGAVTFDQADPRARAIMSLNGNTCRWPIEEGETFRFCCEPATVGYRQGALTYCARCAGEAFAGRARVSDLSMKAA